jgi:thymidylate synthase ThyX
MGSEVFTRKELVKERVYRNLQYEKLFVSPPEVSLEIKSVALHHPESTLRDIGVSTAKQCYAAGISEIKPRIDESSIKIAEATLDGGHHTTRQHANFTWLLNGVTRSTVHDVLHAFSFYNTSQQSQRYVEAQEGNYLIPTELNEKQKKIFIDAANFANKTYFEMFPVLEPEVVKRLKEQYPKNFWKTPEASDKLNSKAHKLSQEVARYLIPIGQKTVLEYSLNELSLLRLWRASEMNYFSKEAKYIVTKMITEVGKIDSSIYEELDLPFEFKKEDASTNEYLNENYEEIDNFLNESSSYMCPISECDKTFLAMAVQNIKGLPENLLPNNEALSLLMDPKNNPILADTYETGIMDPLSKCLDQINLKFISRMSHTADSQRQRQRMTPGSNRTLENIYAGKADYYTPMIIKGNPELKSLYDKKMVAIFGNVNRALDAGIPKKYAHLLLPNGLVLHIFESGSLLYFSHRWKQRSCWKAQEEIFYVTLDQMKATLKRYPSASYLLQAPCGIRQRADIKPKCPEKDQWCGAEVFNMSLDEYSKRRLI